MQRHANTHAPAKSQDPILAVEPSRSSPAPILPRRKTPNRWYCSPTRSSQDQSRPYRCCRDNARRILHRFGYRSPSSQCINDPILNRGVDVWIFGEGPQPNGATGDKPPYEFWHRDLRQLSCDLCSDDPRAPTEAVRVHHRERAADNTRAREENDSHAKSQAHAKKSPIVSIGPESTGRSAKRSSTALCS